MPSDTVPSDASADTDQAPEHHLQLTALGSAPRRRRSPVGPAWRLLKDAHSTVQGLFDSYSVVHAEKQRRRGDRRGRLGRDEQDLLRGALVFAGTGLDASLRQLLRDALPIAIDHSPAAAKHFRDRRRRWATTPPDNGGKPGLVIKTMTADDPLAYMVDCYVDELTTGSLQQTEQIKQVRDSLGIPKDKISDHRIDELKAFLTDRNAIVHDLDAVKDRAPAPGQPRQTTRSQDQVLRSCDEVLQLCRDILREADAALSR
jgi:hypothetical protein